MKQCCAACIGDNHLRREIIPDLSKNTGACDYCGSFNQAVVLPETLRDSFELVRGIYAQREHGRPLLEWLMTDWGMFDNQTMGTERANELLADILGDKNLVMGHFVPVSGEGESLARWQEFREELMHKNRYFPKTLPDLTRLRGLLEYLEALPSEVASTLFRARLQEGPAPYGIDQMGPPPAELATNGRASPAGIPYLYLASEHETAISELRPHTGDLVCVAEFSVRSGLRLADLRNPRKTISPFTFSDEQEVGLLRRDLEFLAMLGQELTRPVRPQSAHIEYLPSQYLCEFIKDSKFDGVMYRSSVGTGTNYALFNPLAAQIKSVVQRSVSRVTVELRPHRSA